MNARCNNDVCPGVLKSQSNEEAMNCTKARVVDEPVDGCKSGLLAFPELSGEQFVLTNLQG